MAKCVYKLGVKTFNSEIELDDYLSAIKSVYEKHGDEVFSRQYTALQESYREILYRQREILDQEVKSGRITIESPELETEDLDNIVGKLDRVGVSQFMKQISSVSGGLLFPEFRAEDYWNNVKGNLKQGIFTDFKNELKDDLWVIFEKDANGEYITHPITTEEEFQYIKKRFTDMWKQQGRIGTVVHDILSTFYQHNLGKETVVSLSEKDRLKKIKEIIRGTDNYKKLLEEYNNDILENEAFIQSVIQQGFKFAQAMQDTFGKDALILPEATVKGLAVVDNETKTVVGRLDLLVIDKDGGVHIVDYKCSPRKYSNYDPAKILTFEYQLAVYRRILQQLGINTAKSIRLWVAPVKFEDFTIDENNKVSLSGVSVRENAPLEELENSRVVLNNTRYTTIENNLDATFVDSTRKVNIPEDQILTKTRNWITKLFPQYGNQQEGTDEGVQDYLTGGKFKRLRQDKETGKWFLQRFKNSSPEYMSDTETEVADKVKQEWLSNRARNLETVQGIKEQLSYAMKNNLKRSADFSITFRQKDAKTAKIPDWAQKQLQRYALDTYRVVDTPPALEALGIILIENQYTHRIDVIRISPTPNLDAKYNLGRGRNTLLGGFLTDQKVKRQFTKEKIMDATRGNIELMETMYALNCIPSVFNNNLSILGEIQVISAYNEGNSAYNDILRDNFTALMNFSNTPESPEVNYFTDSENPTIKMANFTSLVKDTLKNILFQSQNTNKWAFAQDSVSELDKGTLNIPETLAELTKLKTILEERYSETLRNNINVAAYDDFSNPEVRLYAQIMLAIGELSGVSYIQQYKDHARIYEGNLFKAFLFDGFNGNLTDNPGTLRSETLNQVSHMIDVAYQNIRDQLSKYRGRLEDKLDKLKARNGVLNQASLYDRFYDKNVTDDLVFKNPFIDNTLDDLERDILKQILLDINKRRYPEVSTLEDLELKIANDQNLLLVPLLRKSGQPVSKAVSNTYKNLRDTLKDINIKNTLQKTREGVEQWAYDSEGQPQRFDTTWEITNSIDASKNPSARADIIKQYGGLSNIETNLEILALKHEFAYIQKEAIDEVMPKVKALAIHLANQGIILNDNFENDLAYIHNFIKAKVLDKSLENLDSLGNAKEVAKDLMKATSILALAFNPKQLYQIIDGLWKDVRLVMTNSGEAFTFKNFKDSFFWIIQDIAEFNGQLTVGEGLNQLYGINDMDINSLATRYAKDTYGTDRLSKAMFRFASRPDYYNRLTIFGAQMRSDGCFEAHSVVGNTLVYDWTKDKRFDVYAKAGGDITKAEDKEKFNQQKALYLAMAKEMVQDGTMNPDGTRFVLDPEHPKPLPKAYTVRQSEAMKALGDRTYGYYASEKKSLIQSFTMGAIIFQMNTFWSSKKNQYFSGRGYSQEGRFAQAESVDPTDPTKKIKWFMEFKENGDYDIVDYDTGIPYIVWQGVPHEGIIITLNHMLLDMFLGEESISQVWKNYIYADDIDLRNLYRANLGQLAFDLIGTIFIGGMICSSLVGAANAYVIANSGKSLGDAALSSAASLSAQMLLQSTEDFNFMQSIFGRGIQWTPFSINSGWKTAVSLYKCVTGDKDFYDTVANGFSATRNLKPVFNFIKVQTLGRKMGDNGAD